MVAGLPDDVMVAQSVAVFVVMEVAVGEVRVGEVRMSAVKVD